MVSSDLRDAADSLNDLVLDLDFVSIAYAAVSQSAGLIVAEIAGMRAREALQGSHPSAQVTADVAARFATGLVLAGAGKNLQGLPQATIFIAAFGAASSATLRLIEVIVDFISRQTEFQQSTTSSSTRSGRSSRSSRARARQNRSRTRRSSSSSTSVRSDVATVSSTSNSSSSTASSVSRGTQTGPFRADEDAVSAYA